jgi:YD repeat-containing protein
LAAHVAEGEPAGPGVGLYRLTEAVGPEGATTYEYDAVGNRVSTTRSGATTTYDYDTADRITRAGTATHTVDADGNLTVRGADSLQYDQANRLVSATISGQTTTFSYDGDGKRTRKVAGGQPTDYTYDVAA